MLHLKILTPEATLLDEQVRLATLPGAVAPFTVLDHHAPLISHLIAGVIRYQDAQGGEHRLPIKGGFSRIAENGIEVCVEL